MVARSGVAAVAVCFLHSYANPDHERLMGELLQGAVGDAYISLSHQVLREYREYERTSTTVLNAYVGPKVSRYLAELEDILSSYGFSGQLLIMQSNGGVMAPEVARRVPVAMMESGPVGGIMAAAHSGRQLGYRNLIAFDMGGTTAKASMVLDNKPDIAQGYYIGGYASGHPVMLPVVDVVEVGTGGGSIAWIDEVGALKVGPRSAGGQPGPMCYGWGGTEPTITDANVLLGRISASRFLGGEMPLDIHKARRGIEDRLSTRLGLSPVEAALGVVQIAVSNMSLAVRGVSVERGFDPRDFVLVTFGGAGPAHAAAIARELHIPAVVVPRLPAHFSALGMLLTDLRHDFVRTHYSSLREVDFGALETIFGELVEEGREVLQAEGVGVEDMSFERFVDVRYVGQEFCLQTPVSERTLQKSDRDAVQAAFDELHDRRFGHRAAEEPVEIVNLRLTAHGRIQQPAFPALSTHETSPLPVETRAVYLDSSERPVMCPVYDRDGLGAGARIEGPAIIEEYASTTVLFSGDRAQVADRGELLIQVNESKL
jgi:N-methylhydantoinase A